jgi:FAD:protein FMN transferase
MMQRRARPLLGTLVEITLAAELSESSAGEVFQRAFQQIERVHHLMSAHLAESDLSRIAKSAHLRPVKVDADTAVVLRLALQIADESAGAFDPVMAGGALVHERRRPWFCEWLPDRDATWRDMILDECDVMARRPLALDLGGIAKGYAVDLAAGILSHAGASGVVNAGGDLRFVGDQTRSVKLRRADSPGDFFELSGIPTCSLATSAGYGSADDSGRSDLIDFTNGKPAPAAGSVTVFAQDCILADALTKVVLNLSAARASELLSRHQASALLLAADGSHQELPMIS